MANIIIPTPLNIPATTTPTTAANIPVTSNIQNKLSTNTSTYSSGSGDQPAATSDNSNLVEIPGNPQAAINFFAYYNSLTPSQQAAWNSASTNAAKSAIAKIINSTPGLSPQTLKSANNILQNMPTQALDANAPGSVAPAPAPQTPDPVSGGGPLPSNTSIPGVSSDYGTSVAATAFAGLSGLNTTLGYFATQLQQSNNNQTTMQQSLSKVNMMITDWPSPAATSTQTVTYQDVNPSTGNLETITVPNCTQAEAKTIAQGLENDITTFSNNIQEQQLMLQSLANNQQQAVSTVSNEMQADFQTTKSIIGNLRVS